MNINDINEDKIPKTDNYLKSIFERQIQLAKKYHKIENKMLNIKELNIEFTHTQQDIDNPIIQFKIKDYLFRTVEEIAESREVYILSIKDNNMKHFEHCIEELIDSLHFFSELCLLINLNYTDFNSLDKLKLDFDSQFNISKIDPFKNSKIIDQFYLTAFYKICITSNCLKNKPWKKTQMRSDKVRFKKCIQEAFKSLIYLLYIFGLTPESIYRIYIKKSEVNKFRQNSEY